MDKAIETLEVGSHTVKVHYDPDGTSPREFDNLSTIVDWHRRMDVGDRKVEEIEREAIDRGRRRCGCKGLCSGCFEVLARYLRATGGAIGLRPLGMLDHSGITIYLGGGAHMSDSAGWDSGTVGFVYTTHKRIGELCGDGPEYHTPEWVDQALEGEIKEYDSYLRGEVYGFTVEDENGEEVDSCWGFVGDSDYCLAEGRSSAEYHEQQRNLIELAPAVMAATHG